jgi:peptidoglycan/LPS O-acetylase OafA/YrhL
MLINDNGRVKSLDGIRGIAIIFILLYHLFNVGFLYPLFQLGWSGVDLFFVLSGFLITGILLDTKGQKGWYKSFMVRRALRILPLYYSVLIVFAFVAPLSTATNWFAKHQVWFWTHTSNILILREGFFKPFGHFWSLATEAQFYLVWPLFVFLLKPRWLLVTIVLLLSMPIICRSIYTHRDIVYGLPLARLDGLLIGSLLAVLI